MSFEGNISDKASKGKAERFPVYAIIGMLLPIIWFVFAVATVKTPRSWDFIGYEMMFLWIAIVACGICGIVSLIRKEALFPLAILDIAILILFIGSLVCRNF
jgi:hypothetical protein